MSRVSCYAILDGLQEASPIAGKALIHTNAHADSVHRRQVVLLKQLFDVGPGGFCCAQCIPAFHVDLVENERDQVRESRRVGDQGGCLLAGVQGFLSRHDIAPGNGAEGCNLLLNAILIHLKICCRETSDGLAAGIGHVYVHNHFARANADLLRCRLALRGLVGALRGNTARSIRVDKHENRVRKFIMVVSPWRCRAEKLECQLLREWRPKNEKPRDRSRYRRRNRNCRSPKADSDTAPEKYTKLELRFHASQGAPRRMRGRRESIPAAADWDAVSALRLHPTPIVILDQREAAAYRILWSPSSH